MKLNILAIGRARRSPEADLTADYLRRIGPAGRVLGLGPGALIELEGRDKAAESAALIAKIPAGAKVAALDERGQIMGSEDFAALLGDWRDQGAREACFVIGGADGHTEALRERADMLLAFGRMTWPHMLARAMLSEQLYRAVSILGGHPYHRA